MLFPVDDIICTLSIIHRVALSGKFTHGVGLVELGLRLGLGLVYKYSVVTPDLLLIQLHKFC